MDGVASQPRADAARNREAIIDAALVALGRDPHASLLDVAHQAGVGRATLYRHFANRTELVTALRAELLRQAAGIVEAASGADPDDPLRALRVTVESLVPIGLTFRVIVEGGAHADPGFLQARDQVLGPLFRAIHRACEVGVLRPGTDPQWASAALSALLVAAVRRPGDATVAASRVAEQVLDTFLHGFAAEPAEPDAPAEPAEPGKPGKPGSTR